MSCIRTDSAKMGMARISLELVLQADWTVAVPRSEPITN